MRSSTMEALALTAVLVLAAPSLGGSPSADDSPSSPHVTASSEAARADAGKEGSEEGTPKDAAGFTYQNLSTLGALLLGVLGLLWVRRHTAEL